MSDNSLNKTKRVWKATGKLFADICYQWRPTGKKFTLGKLNCGYQWRPTGKKFSLGKLNCGYQWRPTGKKFALGELCPLTKLSVKCSIISVNQQDPNKKGVKKEALHILRQRPGQYICCQNHEDDCWHWDVRWLCSQQEGFSNLQQKNPSNNGNNSCAVR
ncbi:hypothetical protein Tco_0207341 [Tanacetum coccineum]